MVLYIPPVHPIHIYIHTKHIYVEMHKFTHKARYINALIHIQLDLRVTFHTAWYTRVLFKMNFNIKVSE